MSCCGDVPLQKLLCATGAYVLHPEFVAQSVVSVLKVSSRCQGSPKPNADRYKLTRTFVAFGTTVPPRLPRKTSNELDPEGEWERPYGPAGPVFCTSDTEMSV